MTLAAAAVADPARIRPARWGFAGRVGLSVLAAVLLACLASLPWSMGKVETGATELARYEASNLTLNLLPPVWRGLGESDVARIAAARDAGQYVPSRILGTDRLGRDVFARVLAGGSISLLVGLSAALIAVIVGTLYGTIAGAAGGRVDAVLMRFVDILFGLPSILLVVLLAVAVDGILERRGADLSAFARQAINIATLLIAIGGVSWLTMARVIRGQVLSLKAKPFMEACRAIGVSPARQFTAHLLPNLVGPIAVYAALAVPAAILSESFLSFLGIGVREPLPSWGNLAAEGLGELNTVESRWWLLAAPCIAIALTLMSLNFLGDELRERFDPMRGRRVA
ncbi:MAG: ABC transporter permease subunit [Phycisphaera sp.]|nr:ABC transporter permease subunit [Phycisphaera sp.]